ncbi:hypothetical protein C8F04DRAFT_1179269 [Mycena alexandri]|uniref:Uncharacterized protein n=1 Tax=Mycena alexandri TaxID=1745969 RepID=A0AAD6T503_9AGAR|nr:hypothetical protein C8F04DRAFT_1179269 [Mycena alexandri]
MPTTVCIMFGKHGEPLLSAPPPMALSPNLSGTRKNEGLKIQKKNLDGIMLGLKLSNILGPQQLGWVDSHLGHCAETLGWLYLLDPRAVKQFFLHGLTVDTLVFHAMRHYSRTAIRAALKSPCENCKMVIKMINETMEAARPPQNNSLSAAFRYSDQTPIYTSDMRVGIITPGPQGPPGLWKKGLGEALQDLPTLQFLCMAGMPVPDRKRDIIVRAVFSRKGPGPVLQPRPPNQGSSQPPALVLGPRFGCGTQGSGCNGGKDDPNVPTGS